MICILYHTYNKYHRRLVVGLICFVAFLFFAGPAFGAGETSTYQQMYDSTAGQTQVYYDFVENGQLKGGKVTLQLQAPAASIMQALPAYNCVTLIDNGPPDNRINIVIIGDGYTTADMDTYAAHADNVAAGFLAEEPLSSYSTYFNVYRVDVISNESGVDEPGYGIYRDTALDMTFNCANVARLLCINESSAFEAAANAPAVDSILALANSTRYGGAGYAGSDMATLAGGNGDAIALALHEFAHSFAGLADEYDYGGSETYTGPEAAEANASIYTSSQQIPLQSKWFRWSDLPHIDSFEGAKYSKYGIYRPAADSKMRNLASPFYEVNAEQFVLSFYKLIRPIDNALPAAGNTYQPDTQFSIDVIEPTDHSLDVQWYIDDQPIGGATANTFTPSTQQTQAGFHIITAKVTDNTLLVRNPSIRENWMTERRHWSIYSPSKADVSQDNRIDLDDLAAISNNWSSLCDPGNWCQGADTDTNGHVDIEDMLALGNDWLFGTGDLLVDFPFDRIDGYAVLDSSNYRRNAICLNTDGDNWTAGKRGNALDFDGIDDYVEIIGYKGITGSGPRTCTAWIKTADNSNNNIVVSWGTIAPGAKWLIKINNTGSYGTLRAEAKNGYIYGTVNSPNLADNQWHHIAVVLIDDGSPDISEAELYVDGVQIETTALSRAVNTVASANVEIGTHTAAASPMYFKGLIDELRIYNEALTDTEINAVMNGG